MEQSKKAKGKATYKEKIAEAKAICKKCIETIKQIKDEQDKYKVTNNK